jgi:uncharacterized membrane protein YphA (DoxX/SURF4 family)
MFPNGWPGKGLLLLRIVTGTFLIQDGVCALIGSPVLQPAILLRIAATAGLFLLFGLGTPVAGLFVGGTELLIFLNGTDHIRSTLLLATIGITTAMFGPGNWSVDAILFGRRRLDLR